MLFAGVPVTAFFTRGFWAGKPPDEQMLRERYTYLNEVQSNQRKALQELLDA